MKATHRRTLDALRHRYGTTPERQLQAYLARLSDDDIATLAAMVDRIDRDDDGPTAGELAACAAITDRHGPPPVSGGAA